MPGVEVRPDTQDSWDDFVRLFEAGRTTAWCTVVEGYPFDTAGVTATHRGHSSTFAAAHFRRDGRDRRWSRRA